MHVQRWENLIALLEKINNKQESKVQSWVSTFVTFLSSVLIAGAGLYINSSFQKHQLEMQMQVQKIQVLKDFMPYIGDTNVNRNKSALFAISSLGFDSLAIALGYGVNSNVAKEVFENKANSSSGSTRKMYQDALKQLKSIRVAPRIEQASTEFHANKVYNACRIIEIHSGPEIPGQGMTRRFQYDSISLNPIAVINDHEGTGAPNLIFRYDKRNRLIEFRGDYTNGLYEFKHRYGYLGNLITTDTTYYSMGNGRIISYSYLSYDKLGRIISDSNFTRKLGSPVSLFNKKQRFEYDENGNLKGYGKLYDNKINILRSNKIWMFISRDYSISNPYIADRYNANDFPTMFDSRSPFLFLYGYYEGPVKLSYECK